jgi:C-terminal processing protease CtpA/Prc
MSKRTSLYPSLEEFMVQEEITSIKAHKIQEESDSSGLEIIKKENKLILSNPEVYQESCKIKYRKNQGIFFTFRDYKSGVFINNLNQPAIDLGLHFGDQIINMNGISLTGLKHQKVLEHYNLYDPSQLITLMIRDRPYAKIITLTKSSQNNRLGFVIKNGYITDLVNGTSAHLNGLLTDHKLVEVNGQQVFHLDDTQLINKIMETEFLSVHLTIYNREFYEKITKTGWW